MSSPNTLETEINPAARAHLESTGVIEPSQTTGPSQQTPQSDYKLLYEESRAEVERQRAIIAAGRLAPIVDHPAKDAKPGTTAARVRSMLGPVKLHQATRSEKLVALGLNPSEVDDAFLKKCFGRGNDGKTASELFKSNPLRYRQLREASDLLGIYGA